MITAVMAKLITMDFSIKEGFSLATRQSVGEHIQRSEDAYDYALSQFETASRQEHYNETEYSDARLMLENAVNELNKLSLFANEQRKGGNSPQKAPAANPSKQYDSAEIV